MGFFDSFKTQKQDRLEEGLEKTRDSFFGKLNRAVRGKDVVDDEVLDDLEEALVTSDVGVKTTLQIIDRVEERVRRDRYVSTTELQGLIRDEIAPLMLASAPEHPADCDARSEERRVGQDERSRG